MLPRSAIYKRLAHIKLVVDADLIIVAGIPYYFIGMDIPSRQNRIIS